jgi:hypothetical protein
MQIIKDSNNVVIYAGDGLILTTTGMTGPGFSAPTIKSTTHTLETVDSAPSDWAGGWYSYDGEWALTDYGTAQKAAKEAQALLDSITFDTLSTDTWTIPADATTPATVTYTSEDTVYFSVNETSHAVEPVDYTATLEITADAPGPIRVEVKTKQLIITALEVAT